MVPLRAWIAGMVVAVAFGAGWLVQGWRGDEEVSSLKQFYAEAMAASAKAAFDEYAAQENRKNDAIKQAQVRATILQADNDRLNGIVDGLRHDLAGVPARIAKASRAAVDEYAITATVVFEQCTARYSALAGKATGHANDVQLMIDAWPRTSAASSLGK